MNTTTSRIESPVEESVDLGVSCTGVEFMTVPAFVNTVDYPWTMEEVSRFGRKVASCADGIQLPYRPVAHRFFGELRAFPLPMLRRIYDLMAPVCGWPSLAAGRTVRALSDDRLIRHLSVISESTEDRGVRQSIANVVDYLNRRA
jgi:hypothetical protein